MQFDTPPLRTPPPSPPGTGSMSVDSSDDQARLLSMFGNQASVATPPLRTPPPSPPRSRKNSQEISAEDLLDSQNSVGLDYNGGDRVSLGKEIRRHFGHTLVAGVPHIETPPLRTPPPSPPASNHNSFREPDTFESPESPSFGYASTEPLNGTLSEGSFLDNQLDMGIFKSSKREAESPSNTFSKKEFEKNFRWQKGKSLGKGAFGQVYLGLNCDTGELFAAKELQLENPNDIPSTALLNYQQEIELMKKLNHENIVRYLGTQLTSHSMYIFLEYASGGSIRSMLALFGPFAEKTIRVYTGQILSGLSYLHHNMIIHRDIKGANILVDRGIVKLADFGCAKMFLGNNMKSVVGTPYWMAPEVIRDEGYGSSADIWSLGCTIIEMATGKPPWSDEFPDPRAAMFRIGSSTEIPQIPAQLSPEANDFLLLTFHRDPKERGTAASLIGHPFIRFANNSSKEERNIPLPAVPSNNSPIHMFIPKESPRSRDTTKSDNPAEVDSNLLGPIVFSMLPTELQLHVFSFLEESFLSTLALVCKSWRTMMEDDMIWRYKTLLFWRRIKKGEETSWCQLFHSQQKQQRAWLEDPIEMKIVKGKPLAKALNCAIFNSEFLVAGMEDKKIKIWSFKKNKWNRTLKGHTLAVNCLHFADSIKFWSASEDKTIKLWDVKSKKVLKTVEAHVESITSLQYQPGKLVSSSLDKTIKLWDPETLKVNSILRSHKSGILAIHLIDHTIVSCSSDLTIRTFDTRMQKCIYTWETQQQANCLRFDPENNSVVSGSTDGYLREWELTSGRVINSIPAHSKPVTACVIDRNKIVSGSQDCSIKIFDRHNINNSCRTLQGHSGSLASLQFDSEKILSASKDRTVRLWLTSQPKIT